MTADATSVQPGAQAKAMPPVLTVSMLVAAIKTSLERGFRTVDVEGEVCNWRSYPSGHCYFSLKDEGAQIDAVLFASVPCDCRGMLGDGRRVKVRAQATVYPQRGGLQLKVMRIRIAGEGELMARYLALKAKLEGEGLFDRARKRPLPQMPRRIGIVTSPAGAVIHDMCRVLTRRFPNLEIRLFPAQVQGSDAPRSLVAGIAYFDSLAAGSPDGAWRPDIVIIARGGGSFEDLFCFNDESLVRAVAASKTPVISAVGHETDFTLCDFAADVRAGTPSIAAEISVPEISSVRDRIRDCSQSLAAALGARADAAGQRIDRLSDSLVGSLDRRLDEARHRLAALSPRPALALKGKAGLAARTLEALSGRLGRAGSLACERAATRIASASRSLTHLSPFGVLERGYSLTTDEKGVVLRDASLVPAGTRVTTRLAKGSLVSVVEREGASK